VDAASRTQRLERREVSDRRVEPDVEVLARRVGDLDAEVGRVARDVPVGEAAVAAVLAEPLARLRQDFRLQARLAPAILPARPFAQERYTSRVRQPEEVMFGNAQLGRRSGE